MAWFRRKTAKRYLATVKGFEQRAAIPGLDPRELMGIVARCQPLATLEDHSEWTGVPTSILNRLVRAGYLMSEQDIFRACRQSQAPQPRPIERLFVPTYRRPAQLARCLGSVLDNFEAHGRSLPVTVLDDDPANSAAAVCESVSGSGLQVVCVTRADADAYLRKVPAEQQEALRFALMGEFAGRQEGGSTLGSNRNRGLLLGAPVHAYASIDDDVLASLGRYRPLAGEAMAGLTLSSRYDVTQLGVHPTTAAALEYAALAVPAESPDLIGVLGEHLGAGLERVERLDSLAPEAVALALGGRGAVAVTSLGLAGDSGMGSTGYYQSLRGAARRQLLERYDQLRLSRAVTRAAVGSTATTGTCFLSAAFACNLALTPPFFPVYRNSDGHFARLVRYLYPEALFCHEPFLAKHVPPGERRQDGARVKEWTYDVRPAALVGVALSQAIEVATGDAGTDVAQRMERLGWRLARWSMVPLKAFVADLERAQQRSAARRIELLERWLEGPDGGRQPGLARWRRDVAESLGHLREASVVPLMDSAGAPLLVEVRNAVALYGRSLQVWPQVCERMGRTRP